MFKPLFLGGLAASLIACAGPADRDPASLSNPFPAAAFAAACSDWDDWDKPAPPFRVFGNTWYVGTCGITSILITSDQGHLLIDSGTEAGAETVAANIRALGFALEDVRYVTHTQEHFDHVGGMARLQALTNARMVASERAAPVFETGNSPPDDPQFGLHDPIEAVAVDRRIGNGESIRIGAHSIEARYTPGHSPGAISWRWTSCEAEHCLSLVFSDGLGPVAAPDYRWNDHPDYLEAYRSSIDWLMHVDADICLAAHPSQTRLIDRIKADALADATACRSAALATLNRLEGILAAESAR